MSIVLRGGRVVDSGGESVVDVEIGDDGQIAAVGTGLAGDEDLDCAGCVVAPGLVDLHAHLRQPGDEEATFDRMAKFIAESVPKFQITTGPPKS